MPRRWIPSFNGLAPKRNSLWQKWGPRRSKADLVVHLSSHSAVPRQLKYSRDILAPLIKANTSYAGVLKALGLGLTGGSQLNLKSWIQKYGLDTSHFVGQAHLKGVPSNAKLKPEEVLVLNRTGLKEKVHILREALLSSGCTEKCEMCGMTTSWRGSPIRLQIDHRNGNPLDNRLENLRFLCPNCHSQTETFGAKNRGWRHRFATIAQLVEASPSEGEG